MICTLFHGKLTFDFPPSSESQTVPDNYPTHSDEQDDIITDLDLRSTRPQESTDASDTDSISSEADLLSARRQTNTETDHTERTHEIYMMKTVSPLDGNKVPNSKTMK